MRSIISTGLDPLSARSPPWRIKSGAVSRRSERIASNAVRLPWMSETIAIRIAVLAWRLHVRRYDVRIAIFAGQHLVGFGIVREPARRRIKRQLAAKPVADVRHVAQRRRGDTGLHIRVQVLIVAALHGFQEVGH